MHRAHRIEHTLDGIGIGERDTEGLAQLTRPGGDAETTGEPGKGHSRFIARTDDFHIGILAEIRKNALGQKSAAPCGTHLGDLALHDFGGQTAHRPVAIDEPGGHGQVHRAALDFDDVVLMRPFWGGASGRDECGFEIVQFLDVGLQPLGG